MLRKTMLLTVALGSALFGGGFWLTVGNPAASPEAQANNAVLVVRPDGCHEPQKARVTATAEGIVNGRRQSVTLKPIPLSQPGTYALKREWPAEGNWVVAVTATYLQASASSLIPMEEAGFERQAVKSFNRPFTKDELEALLHTLRAGK